MNRIYKFLQMQGMTHVYANAERLQDQILINQSHFSPKGSGVEVYKDSFTKRDEITTANSCDPCNPIKKLVSATVTFSGELSTSAEKLALLDDLKQVILQSTNQLSGFPPNQSTTFTLVAN